VRLPDQTNLSSRCMGESCSGRVFDFETGVNLLGNHEKNVHLPN
jgi:hypothetical protein